MPYLSLYRKYRPRTFAEVVGQQHVTRTLANAVKAGRIAHAYLFCGPRGTGKTSTARVLAMAMNCDQGPTPEPCGVCEACTRISAGSALDVIEIDAASNRGIDEIRELRERVGLTPAMGRMKVYIVDEVHMLTGEAFNAFLKTLEEPPPHVVFVLATTEPHRVLPTILSRCQRFDFHRVGPRDIEDNLRMIASKEAIQVDDKAFMLIAHAADGSVRDALTLLDQAIAYSEGNITPEVVTEILGGVDFDLVAGFTDILTRREAAEALTFVERMIDTGKDLRQFVSNLIAHYRNLLVLRVDRRGAMALTLPEEAIKRLTEQAKALSPDEIIHSLDLFAETDRELRFTSQPRLLMELCAIRICQEQTALSKATPPPRVERKATAPAAATKLSDAAQSKTRRETIPVTSGELNQDDELALAEMRQRWDALLSELRGTGKHSLAAFLLEATPVSVEQDNLTLGFKTQFHYDQMVKEASRMQAVAAAIAKVFGREMQIKCQMGAGEKISTGGTKSGIEDIQSLFPGSKLEG